MFDLALECSGKTIFFFGGTYFIVVTERKEVGGGGAILTETGNRNRNIRKQYLFPNVSETRSRNTKEKPCWFSSFLFLRH